MLQDSLALPPLREELEIEEMIDAQTAQKSWRLYDPLHHRLYILDESDITLLTLWKIGTVGRLKFTLKKMNILFNEQQLEELLHFFKVNELIKVKEKKDYIELKKNYLSSDSFSLYQFIGRIRSTRIPLFFVEPLLNTIEPIFKFFNSRVVIAIWCFITSFGLYFSLRQWDEFIHTASSFYSMAGVISFAMTLIVLKLFHELGHAYFARHFGCRVGRIGVATFFMMPLLYTEMDDVTRLKSKYQKMMVSLGGVFVELLFAGVATFVWAISDDGAIRNIAFLVATTCWVTSIFLNLNPFAKYDGYYVLSDYLGINNLQAKAMSWTSWAVDNVILGKAEAPEQANKKKVFLLVGLGLGTWVYQVIILCAVSYFFYHYFYPIFGLLWLLIMMGTFFVFPILKNMLRLWSKRQEASMVRRVILISIVGLLLLILFLPMSRNIDMVGLNRHKQLETIYAPAESKISEWLVPVNSKVKAGQLIAKFYCPELMAELASINVLLGLSESQLNSVAGDPEQRALSQVLIQEFHELQVQKVALEKQIKQLEWRAHFDGRLVDAVQQIDQHQWVSPMQSLGRIISTEESHGIAYLREEDLTRLDLTQTAKFYPIDPSWPVATAKITELSSATLKTVSPVELSSLYGGAIETLKDSKGELIPKQAYRAVYFKIDQTLDANQLPIQLHGKLVIKAEPMSLAEQVWNNIWQLLLSELRR
ncbi:site-2 protease family protein [Marinomonas epiphytica]